MSKTDGIEQPRGWSPRRAVAQRLKTILASGLTPRKLLVTLCIGGALGLLPIVWGTTLLCIAVAYVFRLNQVVLQSVNYLFYPLQLALIIPYCRLGARLFPWGPPFPAEILTYVLHGHGAGMFRLFAWATFKATGAWLLTAPPLAFVIYLVFSMMIGGKRSASEVPRQ
ncbi:DUF2062 domain-containing protein [Geobacter sp. AOG2]|uniref:DUF2062 domain-containing protein n=1 Tax=Geobacter sp. AOG2 TaxID=1566347 RepID=UPI001CC4698F|nr:DUF2062 domain-containing protein [Geobacter sp. AOG2]GFE60495.1 hypothetical protein AOG2_10830 [Geobacter sp. AOG2]